MSARWRVQQKTAAGWVNVYGYDVAFDDDVVERELYATAARSPYLSFRAVDGEGNLYRGLTEYRVTP